MDSTNYFFAVVIAILLFLMVSCSFIIDRDRNDNIKIEKLEPIVEETNVNCDVDNLKTLTELQVAKCKMEAKLLELKY